MMQVQVAEILTLRLDAVALALTEMARALPPEHAQLVATGSRPCFKGARRCTIEGAETWCT
jgi:hypothetical protein